MIIIVVYYWHFKPKSICFIKRPQLSVAKIIKNVDNPFTNFGLEVNSIQIIHQNIQVSKFYGLSDFIKCKGTWYNMSNRTSSQNEEQDTITLPKYTLATDFCWFF